MLVLSNYLCCSSANNHDHTMEQPFEPNMT
jgi:hypothetical protein